MDLIIVDRVGGIVHEIDWTKSNSDNNSYITMCGITVKDDDCFLRVSERLMYYGYPVGFGCYYCTLVLGKEIKRLKEKLNDSND